MVRGIELHVKPGEVVGLLGPNGAGKTTSFQMIMGLIRPDKGRILLNGDNVTREADVSKARGWESDTWPRSPRFFDG